MQPYPPAPRSAREQEAIAALHRVMRLLDGFLDNMAANDGALPRAAIPNALLNVAVDRMLQQDGAARTATILHRLADLIARGAQPEGEDAFPLTGHDA